MQSALEALAQERTKLLHAAAAVEPVAERPDWQDWRERAEVAMAEASKVAEDAALGEGTREALAASAVALGHRLGVDLEAAELYRDWLEYFAPLPVGHMHRFHAPGTEALADRIAALEKRVAHPLEMPGLLRMGLDDHRERAEEWSRIRECREDLARLAGLEPGSEAWLPDARATARKAAAILNDGAMCRLHGLTGTPMGEEMEGNAAALARELMTHDASERLLRDWEAHAGAAAEEGLHPYHAPGYDALLDRIRDHEEKAGKRMPAPLARVLEEHEPLARSEREVRKLAARLDTCLEKRDALLERAERKLDPWQPVAELGRQHRRWHRAAESAREAGRELLGNERYANHLAALGGRATIERAVERIERAAVLDHLPASVRGGVRDPGRPRPGDRPAPLLPAGARESLQTDVARAGPNPGRRSEGVREGRTRDAQDDERAGSTAGHDEDATRGVPAVSRDLRRGRPPVRAAGGLWRLAVEGRAGDQQRKFDARRRE